MVRPRLLVSLGFALSAAVAHAQVDATFATYGTGCPGTGTGLGASHIVPAIANTSFGSGNAIPLGWTPNRYQQVFLGTDLPGACAFAALQLRNTNTANPIANTYVVDMEVRLGFTTAGPGTLSATFASNFNDGAPVTVLPRSQVTIPDAVTPTGVTDFHIPVPFAVPFNWVPQPGRNLLVEIVVHGNSWSNQIYGYPYDNVNGVPSVWGTPATATTGQLRSFGMAMSLVELTNTAVPRLFSTNTPQINDQFRVRISQGRAQALALLTIGLSNTTFGANPLPLELSPWGAPSCLLLASPDVITPLVLDAAGAGNRQYDIPNNILLLNLRIYHQAIVSDPTVNQLGWVFSNAGVGRIGNQ